MSKKKANFDKPSDKENFYKPDMSRIVMHDDFIGAHRLDRLRVNERFVFLLFEKGSGTHTIDFKNYSIKDHQIHILFPGQLNRFNVGSDTIVQRLMVDKIVLNPLTPTLQFSSVRFREHPVIDLDEATFERIHSEFLLIKKELDAASMFQELLVATCKLIAIVINRWVEDELNCATVKNIDPILYQYQYLIERHFKEQKSVSFYALRLGINPNYLNILCRKRFQKSATMIIQERVVLEAKRLMQGSGMSIKEITFELGFRRQAYFSYFFRLQTGLSPRKYKGISLCE